MKLPDYVKTAIKLLEASNYKVYVVGGAVRDFLLGLNPHDFDLSTNATPMEMKEVFKDYFTIDTGIKHGTITVMINHKLIEITTFRYEDDYADFRRPNTVHFIKSIEEDLARRDFTINSIAYNRGIIDINNGKSDLENKLIRAIGNPVKRFTEDPLRILRALRFASTLDFEIEEETKLALIANFNLLEKVSRERINSELSKLILGNGATKILNEYKTLLEKHVFRFKLDDINIKLISKLDKDLIIRLACLCIELDPEKAKAILKELKYANKIINQIINVIDNNKLEIETNEVSILRVLKRVDYMILGHIINIRLAFSKYNHKDSSEIEKIKTIYEGLKSKYLRVKDLKINGNDLIKIGYKEGIQIRETLEKLLDDCINGLPNEYESLIMRAREYFNESMN